MTTIDAELLTVTFVDSGGITRAKTVPASRADMAATAGIGASTTFSVFTGLDAMGAAYGLEVPTGDFRLVADLDAAAIDGPGRGRPADLCDTDGAPWPTCSRTFARTMEQRAAERGLRLEASFESEFTVWDGDGRPLHEQPAYGVEATRAAGPFLLALVRRLQSLGVEVDQVHPTIPPGQLEVSVGRTGAVLAADRVVLVRDVNPTVARELGPPRVAVGQTGARRARQRRAPAPVAVARRRQPVRQRRRRPRHGARRPAPSSPACWPSCRRWSASCAPAGLLSLRLGPSRWTGVYRCWGLENREAPLRLIQGSRSTRPRGANVELKPVDASGNPYLAVGAAIAAGLAGIEAGLELAPECTISIRPR